MIEKFKEWVEGRHDYAKEWKRRTGGKVLGYMCCYAPEEIAYAAGILPVRIDSEHKPQDLSAPHMSSACFCPYSRDVLGAGLKGTYDYLDGLFIGRSCVHMQLAYDCWVANVPPAYNWYVDVPHIVQHKRARPLLQWELGSFKRSLEKWLGQPISQDKIKEAIEVYNTNRRLLMRIWELRKADPPPLSGEEAIYLVLASMVADKAEVNKELEKLVSELPQRQDGPGDRVRLLLVGGENSNPELLRLLEEVGNVVTDDQCYGRRYFWGEVATNRYADPLEAIAARYLEKPRCPLKDCGEKQRSDYILGLIRDWDAKGVVHVLEKFCDPHEFELPSLSRLLRKHDIPFLTLELDTTLAVGPMKTRVEALVEQIELEV